MLSLIQIEGDSMSPTLNHGDDIMVDNRAATVPYATASTLSGWMMY